MTQEKAFNVKGFLATILFLLFMIYIIFLKKIKI